MYRRQLRIKAFHLHSHTSFFKLMRSGEVLTTLHLKSLQQQLSIGDPRLMSVRADVITRIS